ncbi:MAG TPA: hypothetical protein DEF18_02250 [Muricauda sp.]|uniref:Uncharacterized protein n=2 Tax=Flagellimonas aurea TaxID=2915619 RepID=A0ABS3G7J5_9FLAO|nr:hypothetical protein [Allomuricauda sp.]MBO0355383.1 hypothetical protein [Allomuricauda aurea]HBU76899.1 hypothetical protein [Allomuricauda sp.]
MIGLLRNSTLLKVFWGLMSLYLLNISVDSPDRYPDYIPEDLSINDQESIIEILVEKVLGYGDVFKEYDDPDKEDHNSGSSLKIKLTVHQSDHYYSRNHLLMSKKKKFPDKNLYFPHMYTQKDTPPPEV